MVEFAKRAVRFLCFVRHYYRSSVLEASLNGELEKKLVWRCQNGDKSAYAGLVEAYSGRVFAICLGILGHSHDAEDVAQQTLLKGFSDIDQLRNGEQFGTWLGRVAKNLCIDLIRRQKRKTDGLSKRPSAVEGRGKEDYSQLQAALSKLPEQHRVALVLYYFESRKSHAIAQIVTAIGTSPYMLFQYFRFFCW